ncbi:Hypothetical predicted protein [Lecanosticta acicola]|uniref:Uncharacterized protein n=1 Tax=Lecanosticta acicola TaxID=111012 RepID=A0AAI9EE83_9PEZI|nr:Hypothetical predicted protein [Lecanosticta acicola]
MSIRIKLEHRGCRNGNACQSKHANIRSFNAEIVPTFEKQSIGHIHMNVLGKNEMDLEGMWEECRAYDEYHLGGKLEKIENFISNEAFRQDKANMILKAECILYIEEVVLLPKFRGYGWSLDAVKTAIAKLQVPAETVVMLQAGAVGEHHREGDAGEKLTKHWKRIGFTEWSTTDDSWLLLSVKKDLHVAGRDS